MWIKCPVSNPHHNTGWCSCRRPEWMREMEELENKTPIILDALNEVRGGVHYLAIPYSHPDPTVVENRFEIANRVTAKLLHQGLVVFSPISMSHPIAIQEGLPGDWASWERFDRVLIRMCSCLLVTKIDGWDRSTGVQAEIKIAREYGLPVKFVDEDGNIGDPVPV